jgi:crotonobetainyl-CoA:carnitine CoA-transferase CaiB-like acyl-CoA transferase
VLTRLSEFGLEGPHARWAGSELVNLAAGGLLFLTGTHDLPPVQTAPHATQLLAGLLAADVTLAALYAGEPVTLDLSKQEDVVTMVNPAVSEYGYSGTIPARDGPVSAMARIERSKDGWVYAGPGAAASADYQAYSKFLEISEFAEPRFATPDARMENWEEHQRLLGPKLLERTSREWADAAASWRLTFGLTQTTSELLDCAQLNGRDFFGPLGEGLAPAAPYLVNGERPSWPTPREG